MIHSIPALGSRRRFIQFSLAGAALAGMPAWAQSGWRPDRPVRLIIPYSPGGVADIVGRLLSQNIQPVSGQPWVVENKPGASGNIATDFMYAAKPDGFTMQVTNLDTSVLNAYLYPSRKGKIEAATPVAGLAKIGMVLMVRPGLGVSNLAQFIEKARSTSLSYASWGIGSSAHLSMLLLQKELQLPEMLHVPYSGGGEGMQALLKGEVDMYLTPFPLAMAQRNSGVVSIALAGSKRSDFWPELPTLLEQGGPGTDLSSWFGVFAPPQTPANIVAAMTAFVESALARPEMQASLKAQYLEPMPANVEQFKAFIAQESQRWGKVIQDGKLTLE